MQTASLKSEKRYLVISAIGNAVVACVGVTVAVAGSSQAILLDGLFNLSYFATGLFTVKVASLVRGDDDERFPLGYSFFEPLVNGLKGMLVLGVSVMALFGAIETLLAGGRPIAAGMAIAYGVFASITCWAIALAMRHGTKTTGSPLVGADAENWTVNAAISSCVLLAFAGILVLRAFDLDALVPYVDPAVVLAVVLISFSVPVRMSWNALMSLLNRAPSSDIVRQVKDIVDASLAPLPVRERFVRVIQPGRQRFVLVHVVLPANYHTDGLVELDAIRARMFQALCETKNATIVDVLFTTDRQWGAPMSDGGPSGQVSRK
jgi:predicted Co/Zn/Cd cation transporter (cation efflux family)